MSDSTPMENPIPAIVAEGDLETQIKGLIQGGYTKGQIFIWATRWRKPPAKEIEVLGILEAIAPQFEITAADCN